MRLTEAKRLVILVATIAAMMFCGCSSAGEKSSSTASETPERPSITTVDEEDASEAREEHMVTERIVIDVGGQEYSATLADTEAAREFAALLPLQLQMEELNGNEKYSYLDNPMPTDARNPGTIHAGDIMLFGSSCIVLFYDTFPTQYTYTPIATLDDPDGLAEAVGRGDVEVRIGAE